jgi:hypothetical protein
MDGFKDMTGKEKGSEPSLQKLQMQYNDVIRTALGIEREDHVDFSELLPTQSAGKLCDDLAIAF